MTCTQDGHVYVLGDAASSRVDEMDDCIIVSTPSYLQGPMQSNPKRRRSYARSDRRAEQNSPQEQACTPTQAPVEQNPSMPQINIKSHLLPPHEPTKGATPPRENVVPQGHNADPTWLSQSCGQWDPRTESFLRSAITDHDLFADPTKDPEDLQKMGALYHQFYNTVDFKTWKPSRNDPNLWLLFTTKITNVRAAMARDGEVVQVKEGLKLSAKRIADGNAQGAPVQQQSPYLPFSTPLTPPMSHDSMPFKSILDSWAVLDANEQMILLGKLMRTAKDSSLMSAEDRNLAEKLSSKNGLASHLPAELADTPPIDQQSMDMKTIIQESIRKMKLKRYLEKRTPESDAENGSSKRARLKLDPTAQKLE